MLELLQILQCKIIQPTMCILEPIYLGLGIAFGALCLLSDTPLSFVYIEGGSYRELQMLFVVHFISVHFYVRISYLYWSVSRHAPNSVAPGP